MYNSLFLFSRTKRLYYARVTTTVLVLNRKMSFRSVVNEFALIRLVSVRARRRRVEFFYFSYSRFDGLPVDEDVERVFF